MVHTVADYGPYMVVGQGIEYGLSLTPEFYKLCLFENPQLMGNG